MGKNNSNLASISSGVDLSTKISLNFRSFVSFLFSTNALYCSTIFGIFSLCEIK